MVERGWQAPALTLGLLQIPQLSFLNIEVQCYYVELPSLIQKLTCVVVDLSLLGGTGPPRVQWQLLVLYSGAF